MKKRERKADTNMRDHVETVLLISGIAMLLSGFIVSNPILAYGGLFVLMIPVLMNSK